MADQKISELNSLAAANLAADDQFVLVDTSGTETKKISKSEVDTLYADASHTHTESDITDLGSYIEDISGESLGDLSDVTITAISSGELLVWNGSAWINQTLAEAGIASASHSHAVSDITSGTLAHERGGLEADISAIVDGDFIVGTGSGTLGLESGDTARTSLGLGTGNSPTFTRLTVSQSTGTAPFTVASTTVVSNLNADLIDGIEGAELIQRDGSVAFTGNQAMGSNRLTGLAEPTASTDAATKAYVDAAIDGLDYKDSVRVATTTAGTLASDFENGDSVDGVTLATGDRILVKNQTTASENGIYTVNVSGAPSRAADLASASSAAGAFAFVEEGTTNGDKGFVCTANDGSDVVGTDDLAWAQFSGSGGGGETNTASNVGTGQGVFKQKTGVDFEFYEIKAGSSKITVSLVSDDITIDLGTVVLDDLSDTDIGSASTGDFLEFDGSVWTNVAKSAVDHGAFGGLSDDDHTQYALLAGRSGGQDIIGGTASGNDLTFESTSDATKGHIQSKDNHQFDKTAYFDAEVDNGNSGTADTIDFGVGNKQKSTLTDNVTFTFTAPPGPCNLILKLVQDATGSRTVTWPATVKWPSNGTAPTLSTGANDVDIVSFYFDGTNYYGQAGLDFA